MAIQHEWQGDRFVVRASGSLGMADSLALFDRYYSDPRSAKTRGILFDCSGCKRFEFTDGDIAQMSALEFGGSRGLPVVRIAFVGAGSVIRPFFDRYLDFYESVYESVDAQWEIELFEDLPEAEAWLDSFEA